MELPFSSEESFYQASQYKAFAYNVPGVKEDSYVKSLEEEHALISKLTQDTLLRHSSPKDDYVWYSFNNQVNSVTQGFQRPMCGLVALHMAAQMVKLLQPSISQPSVLEIFNKAIEMELSKQGEMFSAFETAKLASFLYGCKADVVDGNLFTNRLLLLKYLLLGWPVLVPYDNDKNFEPCLKNGHKAHWAVLTGAVLKCSNSFIENQLLEKIRGMSKVFQIPRQNRSKFSESLTNQIDRICNVYVFAKQGKSAKNRLWSLETLSQSNSNLTERDPCRDWTQYHCPYSLKETLREKCVVLYS